MNLEAAIEVIATWAASERLVKRVYIFGSRARADYRSDSDLDIAVELYKQAGDESVLATWIHEHHGLAQRLSSVLPYKLQLELLDGERTPTVLSGVMESSICVYNDA